MLRLANGTTIPTDETREATYNGDGLLTLRDGRQFQPALLRDTDIECSRCEREDRRNVSGNTPRLQQRDDDGFIGCVVHDGQRLTGHTEVV